MNLHRNDQIGASGSLMVQDSVTGIPARISGRCILQRFIWRFTRRPQVAVKPRFGRSLSLPYEFRFIL
jgi:hypothetical protein